MQKMMDVNYIGSVHATKAALKRMKSNRTGRIVFLSSQAGQLGVYGYTGYSATKYALRGFAEALQMEVMIIFIAAGRARLRALGHVSNPVKY
jgi:3-dehydrosphinganine reductase